MKRKIGMMIGIVLGIVVLGIGLFYSGAPQTEAAMTKDEVVEMVEKQYPGEVTDVKQEKEFKQAVYHVKITGREKEYSLKLNGDDGEVLDIKERPLKKKAEEKQPVNKEKDKKEEKKPDKHQERKDRTKEEPKITEKKKTDPKTVISPQKAGEIALKEFSGEIDEIELEEEDGRLIYEVEIERDDLEAEIEIDAYTGEIIVIEIEED